MHGMLLALLLCYPPQPDPLPDPTPDEPPPEPPEPLEARLSRAGVDWSYTVGDDTVFVSSDGQIRTAPKPGEPIPYDSPVFARSVKAEATLHIPLAQQGAPNREARRAAERRRRRGGRRG